MTLAPRRRTGRWLFLAWEGVERRRERARERVPSQPIRRVPVAVVLSVKVAVIVSVVGLWSRLARVLDHCDF